MTDDIYGHWVRPNGKPHTRRTMARVAIERLRRALEEEKPGGLPQDGSSGQYDAFAACMVRALEDSLREGEEEEEGAVGDCPTMCPCPTCFMCCCAQVAGLDPRLCVNGAAALDVGLEGGVCVCSRNLLVHRCSDQPRRIVNAWRIGAQDDLIADAVAMRDVLLVVSCAMKRLEVPWRKLQRVSKANIKTWGQLRVAEDGSYVHWPEPDIHLDLGALRRLVDPAAREAARVERVKSQEGFGAAVAALRKAAGLTQSAIEGVSARQVRRIEAGQVFPRVSTLAKLAAAHGQATNDYLDALAREQTARLTEPQ